MARLTRSQAPDQCPAADGVAQDGGEALDIFGDEVEAVRVGPEDGIEAADDGDDLCSLAVEKACTHRLKQPKGVEVEGWEGVGVAHCGCGRWSDDKVCLRLRMVKNV